MLLWFRDVPIDNPKALQVHSYYQFLFHYFLWKSKIFWYNGANRKILAEWLPAILTDVRDELAGKTREWFLTKTFVNLYHTNDYMEVDEVFPLVPMIL
ncbi:MAG: hypothetical protein HC905_29020 [Bacteroidales bacterium]|nr:hypothetical protein [Bacteroidales bacterium]